MINLPKRKLIKGESPIEDIVLREFHLLGFYPEIQFKVGRYRIDLAFPKDLVAIECDGREWHSSEEQIERDKKRDKYLEKNGWQVIRITGREIYRKADEIIGVLTGKKKDRVNFGGIREYIKNEIDYENENLDIIAEKEEQIKFQQEDIEFWNKEKDNKFFSLKEALMKRYGSKNYFKKLKL